MSLSYLELETTRTRISPRLIAAWRQGRDFGTEVARELRGMAASAAFRPAALRVTTALALSFGLVQFAKHFLS